MNDNEKVEVLSNNRNNNTINSNNQVAVVTNNEVHQEVETITVDENGQVQPISLDYNEYRNSLNKIYQLSTSNNSLILNFSIVDGICKNTVILKQPTLQEEVKKSGEFAYNKGFIDSFLIPTIEDYNRFNQIFSSNIEILDGDKANFVVRTNKNDCLIVMGIDMTLANRLKDLVTLKEDKVSIVDSRSDISNQKGISNYLVIILTIIAIGMTLVGTIFFTIMSNK